MVQVGASYAYSRQSRNALLNAVAPYNYLLINLKNDVHVVFVQFNFSFRSCVLFFGTVEEFILKWGGDQPQITMKQPESLDLVAEFHRTFHHPIQSQPLIPDEGRCKLRVALIAEELKELEVAILEKDIVGVADALADIQYVLSGAVLEFGLGEKFKALFEEVQRSNMSKACDSEDEAKRTKEHYLKKDGTECYYKEVSGKWLVYRSADNKTMKSINYSPANLEGIVLGEDSIRHKTQVGTQRQVPSAG